MTRRRRDPESTAYAVLRAIDDAKAVRNGRIGRWIYGRMAGKLAAKLFRCRRRPGRVLRARAPGLGTNPWEVRTDEPILAPWRVAIVDRSTTDPKLLVAMIGLTGDVLALTLDEGGRYDWPLVLSFVERRVGEAIEMTRLTSPAAWSIRAATRRPR